jgi:endoglucanase
VILKKCIITGIMKITKNNFKDWVNRPLTGIVLILSFIALSASVNSYGQDTTSTYAFKQNERLGRGGNIGTILYNWENWDKEREREEMDKMREIGLKGMRINTRPFLHMNKEAGYGLSRNEAHGYSEELLLAKEPPYIISEAFFERLDWTVKEALERGFTVIIDNHQYRVMGKDPMGLKEMFDASWEQMAKHYKDYPDNVYFGLLNEPNGHLTSYLWNYLMMDAYRIVRKSNPNRTLVIGPGNWNGINALEDLRLPEEDRNIIVEIHYYSPHIFTHQRISGRDTVVTWNGTPEEIKAVEEDFNKAAEWGKKRNRPLFLGEFGVANTADRISTVKWLKIVVEQMEKYGMSWSMWDLMGSNMGIYDEKNREWIKHRKDAIVSPD